MCPKTNKLNNIKATTSIAAKSNNNFKQYLAILIFHLYRHYWGLLFK